jgi:hypothetical protein
MTTPCLKLPGFVVQGMYDLGVFDVPDGDICGMVKVASAWDTHGSRAAGPPRKALAAAEQVWNNNKSAAVDAFRQEFTGPHAPVANLTDASSGARGIGIGVLAGAGILGSLMVLDIAQVTWMLIAIAEAVATAIVTFGGSLLEILGIKEVTTAALNTGINTAANAVMGR